MIQYQTSLKCQDLHWFDPKKIRLDKRQNCDIIISLLIKCGSSSVVEHNLAKVGVAGSSPVFRSIVSYIVRCFDRFLKSSAGRARDC